MKPLIIEVGLNESAKKEQNPRVPYSPEEIAADVIACAEAGASIVHFHARDSETGANRMNDTDLYLKAFEIIRSTGCDVNVYPPYEPMELDLKVRFQAVFALVEAGQLDVGVLDMGSFNLIQFIDGEFRQTSFMPLEASVYQNSFQGLKFMLEYYADHDLIPNLAVFEPGWLQTIFAFLMPGFFRCPPLGKLFLRHQGRHVFFLQVEGLVPYVHRTRSAAAG